MDNLEPLIIEYCKVLQKYLNRYNKGLIVHYECNYSPNTNTVMGVLSVDDIPIFRYSLHTEPYQLVQDYKKIIHHKILNEIFNQGVMSARDVILKRMDKSKYIIQNDLFGERTKVYLSGHIELA